MNERETERDQIYGSDTSERDRLFYEAFGIPFSFAKEMSTWNNEIGDRWRDVFKYLMEGKTYEENRQDSTS